jgi:hypothetical protein
MIFIDIDYLELDFILLGDDLLDFGSGVMEDIGFLYFFFGFDSFRIYQG